MVTRKYFKIQFHLYSLCKHAHTFPEEFTKPWKHFFWGTVGGEFQGSQQPLPRWGTRRLYWTEPADRQLTYWSTAIN